VALEILKVRQVAVASIKARTVLNYVNTSEVDLSLDVHSL